MYNINDDHYMNDPRNYCKNAAEINLMNTIRSLWEQHAAWTRSTITSIVFSQPDEEFVTRRLLRNPEDFADALRPFYGESIASRFSGLLTEHLVIAAELIKAIKAGLTKKAKDAEKRWYQNAKDIAAFLAQINPFWSEESWKAMMFEHLRLVTAEAVEMLRGNYQASINATDENEEHVLEMADMMITGIIMQFPEQFE
jgi:hypothetical protein